MAITIPYAAFVAQEFFSLLKESATRNNAWVWANFLGGYICVPFTLFNLIIVLPAWLWMLHKAGKLPRFRFTIRLMMIGIAVVALLAGLFRATADYCVAHRSQCYRH